MVEHIKPFIRIMSGLSLKKCPCLSSAAPALTPVSQTTVSPVCYHPCWTPTNPVTSFTLQLLCFTEGISKHLFTARLHTLIQNAASPSPVQAQCFQVFSHQVVEESQYLFTKFTWLLFSSFSVYLSRDTVHAAQAVRILLLPLDIITGQTLLGATGKTHWYIQ